MARLASLSVRAVELVTADTVLVAGPKVLRRGCLRSRWELLVPHNSAAGDFLHLAEPTVSGIDSGHPRTDRDYHR